MGNKRGPYNDRPLRQDEPTHSEDGADLTLICWRLFLTPAERLEVRENNVRSILRLRGETTLATLIKVKEEVAHDKDRAVLAVLRRTLEEKSKS